MIKTESFCYRLIKNKFLINEYYNNQLDSRMCQPSSASRQRDVVQIQMKSLKEFDIAESTARVTPEQQTTHCYRKHDNRKSVHYKLLHIMAGLNGTGSHIFALLKLFCTLSAVKKKACSTPCKNNIDLTS